MPDFFALATQVPARRVEFRLGKMTLPDFFDVNDVGTDSHLQFLNWTADNNGAWDYAADTRGYTVGGMAEYDDHIWSLRYGLFAMPIVANGIDMDWAFSRAHGQNGEFELRHRLRAAAQKGIKRMLFFANRAHMGDLSRGRRGLSRRHRHPYARPSLAHEHFGALKYGFGYNTEQEITENLRLFGRFGWNEGQHESFAYTEVDQTVEAGADYAGYPLASPRRQDRFRRCLQRHQARPPELSEATAASVPARRRQPQLRPREHRRGLLHLARLARPLRLPSICSTSTTPATTATAAPPGVGSVRAHVDF